MNNSNFWPRVVLWFCGIMTSIVLMGFMAMFLKSTYQYLSLPIIEIPQRECIQVVP